MRFQCRHWTETGWHRGTYRKPSLEQWNGNEFSDAEQTVCSVFILPQKYTKRRMKLLISSKIDRKQSRALQFWTTLTLVTITTILASKIERYQVILNKVNESNEMFVLRIIVVKKKLWSLLSINTKLLLAWTGI